MVRLRAIAGLFACLFLVSGTGCYCWDDCWDDDEVVIVPALGTVSVEFTIAGTKDPIVCDDLAVSYVQFVVYDRYGWYVTQAFAPCREFDVTAVLPVNTYFGNVLLIDAQSRPRSLALPLDLFTVTEGTVLIIDVDFPSGSIL